VWSQWGRVDKEGGGAYSEVAHTQDGFEGLYLLAHSVSVDGDLALRVLYCDCCVSIVQSEWEDV
jgi:hypothetical protein